MARHKNPHVSTAVTLEHVSNFLQVLAPLHQAAPWDRVGLVSGPADAPLVRILISLDLTRSVADEAIRNKSDLLVCYHPPLFKPITDLRIGGNAPHHLAVELAAQRIWIYSPHTALDAAMGGTNDALAAALGMEVSGSLLRGHSSTRYLKLVTFVPESAVERLADAVFHAGAGQIGKNSRYSQCSFRSHGTGTFFGDENTSPSVGRRGTLEVVPEIRFETVLPANRAAEVVTALKQAHPYEEPAFDLLVMENPPDDVGMGRIAQLKTSLPLRSLAKQVRAALHLSQVQVVGPEKQNISRVALIAGSAGRMPLEALESGATFDAVITGELKHHDMLALRAAGLTAICVGHAASEQPVLAALRDRLKYAFPALAVSVSRGDPTPYVTI